MRQRFSINALAPFPAQKEPATILVAGGLIDRSDLLAALSVCLRGLSAKSTMYYPADWQRSTMLHEIAARMGFAVCAKPETEIPADVSHAILFDDSTVGAARYLAMFRLAGKHAVVIHCDKFNRKARIGSSRWIADKVKRGQFP